MSSRPSSFALTSPGKLRLYSTQELLRLPPPEYLIDGILPAGGLVGLYGPPNHGKSFAAVDMALSVATGRPWQGHPTKQGYVIYVAAEGGVGMSKRVRAWVTEYAVDAKFAAVAWLTQALPIQSDSADMNTLFERINDEINEQPALVIIDTLARCFDGDENMQEDMGKFIGGVDRLRREFDATVIVVHHTRLDADRERGSTAFRGAADTMIGVKQERKTGVITFTCDKQKDDESFASMDVRLKVVTDTKSCVIVGVAQEATTAILAAIRKAGSLGIGFKELQAHCSGLTISPATLKRRLVSLNESGQIIKDSRLYFDIHAHGN